MGSQFVGVIYVFVLASAIYLASANDKDWKDVLTLGGADNTYNDNNINHYRIDDKEFNQIFWDSYFHIIRRLCVFCKLPYREIYYKQLTLAKRVDIRDTFSQKDWNNPVETGEMGKDWNLYSTLDDALRNKNEWKPHDGNCADPLITYPIGPFACYGDAGIKEDDNWAANADLSDGDLMVKDVLFSVYIGTSYFVNYLCPSTFMGKLRISTQEDKGDCALHAINNLNGFKLMTLETVKECKLLTRQIHYGGWKKTPGISMYWRGQIKLLNAIGVEGKNAFGWTDLTSDKNLKDMENEINSFKSKFHGKRYLGLFVDYKVINGGNHAIALKYDHNNDIYMWINGWKDSHVYCFSLSDLTNVIKLVNHKKKAEKANTWNPGGFYHFLKEQHIELIRAVYVAGVKDDTLYNIAEFSSHMLQRGQPRQPQQPGQANAPGQPQQPQSITIDSYKFSPKGWVVMTAYRVP